jgi:hypothetical protein
VNNTEAIRSRGELYHGCPFGVALPDERDDQIPQLRLEVDNVARDIVAAIRSIQDAPTVQFEVCLAATLDVIEAGPFNFTLRGCEYDAGIVSGTLLFEDVLSEPFPAGTIDPARYPGTF